jgi:hypothetical protein
MVQAVKQVSRDFIKDEHGSFVKCDKITPVNGAPSAGEFRSDIIGRAPIIDLENDCKVSLGAERIMIHQIHSISSETDSSNRSVFGANDKFDQIRFAGGWVAINGPSGTYMNTSTINDYVEITFYGTGLNLVHFYDADAKDWSVSVDGGAYGGNIYPTSPSLALKNRKYNINAVTNLATSLSLGIHTVKVRLNNGTSDVLEISGFEILNEEASGNLTVNAGTAFIEGASTNFSQSIQAHDSVFETEYGSLGTRGGRVLVYGDINGGIKKDIQWTDTAQKNLTLTDHSNEEVIAKYYWREFGMGRSDDFSTLITTSDRAYTLSDGTATLVCNDVDAVNEGENVRLAAIGSFFILTFVGTGLDFTSTTDSIGQAHTVTVDGTVVGSGTGTIGGADNEVGSPIKLVSGLPYGTHTVKVERTDSAGSSIRFRDFIVYGPKKPELPAQSIELGEYYLMADHVLSTSPTQKALETSSGVLRKLPTREMVFMGTGWTVGSSIGLESTYFKLQSATSGDAFEYTFFGTGVEVFWTWPSATVPEIRLDGVLLGTTGTVDVVNGTYDTGTSRVTENTAATTFRLSDLPLGLHTISFTKTNAQNFQLIALDIITPIHFPKRGNFNLQSNLRVGSTSMGDSRKIAGVDDTKVAISTTQILSAGLAYNGTTSIPIAGLLHTSFKSKTGKIEINLSGNIDIDGSSYHVSHLAVDGAEIPATRRAQSPNGAVFLGSRAIVEVEKDKDIHISASWFSQTGAANGVIDSSKASTPQVSELSVKDI